MFKKLKIYLDTSVINFLFAEDVPELKRITEEFFGLVKEGRFNVFISDAVVNEVLKTNDEEKKRKLLSVIEEHRQHKV